MLVRPFGVLLCVLSMTLSRMTQYLHLSLHNSNNTPNIITIKGIFLHTRDRLLQQKSLLIKKGWKEGVCAAAERSAAERIKTFCVQESRIFAGWSVEPQPIKTSSAPTYALVGDALPPSKQKSIQLAPSSPEATKGNAHNSLHFCLTSVDANSLETIVIWGIIPMVAS